MSRILLIELVPPNNIKGGVNYPFIKGHLTSRGIEVRWLRFALETSCQYHSGENGFGLPPEDIETLIETIVTFHATQLLFNNFPAESTLRALYGRFPNIEFAVLQDYNDSVIVDDDILRKMQLRYKGTSSGYQNTADQLVLESPYGANISLVGPETNDVVSWVLGKENFTEGNQPESLFEWENKNVDYGFELCNELSRKISPFIYIWLGDECYYFSELSGSTFFTRHWYEDLPQSWGCSFCPKGHMNHREKIGQGNPENVLRLSLTALERTLPKTDSLPQYVIDGYEIAEQPEILAHLANEIKVPPGIFVFSYRPDQVVKFHQSIQNTVEMLSASNYGVKIVNLGVQSFSESQLDRYHRDYSPGIALQAIRILREIRAKYPHSFEFIEGKTITTILYDPWTTFSEISNNLAVVKLFGLDDLLGRMLDSRIRFMHRILLAQVAKHEKLLVDRYEDKWLETAKRHFYSGERPWRFNDKRVEIFNRLAARLLSNFEGDDAISILIKEWKQKTNLEITEMVERLFEEVLHCEIGTRTQELLSRAMKPEKKSLVSQTDIDLFFPAIVPGMNSFERLDNYLDFESCLAGKHKTAKLKLSKYKNNLKAVEETDMDKPNLTVLWRRKIGETINHYNVFVGKNCQEVEDAMLCSNLMEKERPAPAINKYSSSTMDLLGYPKCCVEKFISENAFYRNNTTWLHLKRRLESPAVVQDEYHPLLNSYVPCSLKCNSTSELTRQRFARLIKLNPSIITSWAVIMFFDRPGEYVALEPVDQISQQFNYRLTAWWTQDPRLKQLRDGDTLIIEAGIIKILQNGCEIGWFALDAFLWSKEHVFNPVFWRECLREIEDPLPGINGQRSSWINRKKEKSLKSRIEYLFTEFINHPKNPLEGFQLNEVGIVTKNGEWQEISVTIQKMTEYLRFFINPRQSVTRGFCETEHFILSYDKATPIDTIQKERMLRRTLKLFESYREMVFY